MEALKVVIVYYRQESTLDDTALQLYKEGDYGSYLDLDASINEQQEEFENFQAKQRVMTSDFRAEEAQRPVQQRDRSGCYVHLTETNLRARLPNLNVHFTHRSVSCFPLDEPLGSAPDFALTLDANYCHRNASCAHATSLSSDLSSVTVGVASCQEPMRRDSRQSNVSRRIGSRGLSHVKAECCLGAPPTPTHSPQQTNLSINVESPRVVLRSLRTRSFEIAPSPIRNFALLPEVASCRDPRGSIYSINLVMSSQKNRNQALNQILQSMQAGGSTPKPLTSRELTPPTPPSLVISRSRLDLSNYPCTPEGSISRHLRIVMCRS
ncbi:hypothetical protein J6590_009784 [Homalodisca vitripennis]|nr:hypothetical protein J6590_009784 [Homalodisca vitripennis]